MSKALDKVKSQKWFYEFELPDGTTTESYLPELARQIHKTREKALRHYLSRDLQGYDTCLDISSHEGYFSVILSEYFASVTGLDKNPESLEKATQIVSLLGKKNIAFQNTSVELWSDDKAADFVLCFGLLYHVENPVEIIRKIAALTKKSVCIETQILPYDVHGPIEDGSYMWQRDLQGSFGLCVDYSHRAEGGLTDLALVPSRKALDFLLRQFGFKTVEFFAPEPDDYEQFVRQHRVVVFAEK